MPFKILDPELQQLHHFQPIIYNTIHPFLPCALMSVFASNSVFIIFLCSLSITTRRVLSTSIFALHLDVRCCVNSIFLLTAIYSAISPYLSPLTFVVVSSSSHIVYYSSNINFKESIDFVVPRYNAPTYDRATLEGQLVDLIDIIIWILLFVF